MSLIFFLILLGQLHVQYNLVSWTQPYWYNVLPQPLLRHKGCIWDVSLAMPQIPLLYSTVAKVTVFFGSGLILLSYELLEVAFPSYKSTLQIKLFTYQYFSLPIDFQLSFWCRLLSWEASLPKIDWRWNKCWQMSPCCELRLHILDEDKSCSASGNYCLAIFKEPKSYDSLKKCLSDNITDVNTLSSIEVNGITFSIEYYLGEDWKILALSTGIDSASSTHACIWCKCPAIECHISAQKWSMLDPKFD